jgi:nucleoid-associated protein YgaU
MISATSRYADSTLVTEPLNDGTDVVVITPGPAVSFTFNYVFYNTNGADRIDDIAYAYYGDPTQWWRIADANPQIMNWLTVPPATIIRIPTA